MVWLLLPAAAGLSFFLTGSLRRYALVRSLMDIPNERSSHSLPTPRGGGLSFVVVFLLCLMMLGWLSVLPARLLLALFGAGVIVAMIGWLDDHGHVAARWRLLAHFSAAIWSLAWIGGLAPLPMLGWEIDLWWPGHLLAVIYLVWLLNLYNFMDGIDGIAGVEAVTVSLGGLLLFLLCAPDSAALAWLPALLGGTVLGFLIWNFPPAKIFMGDAGSGFLGMMLGVISIIASHEQSQFFWSWIILLGVFSVDATVTLLRRVMNGEKVYEAHRSHAYQYASRQLGAHKPVTLAVGAINLLWLLPIALLVGMKWLDGLAGVLIAYTPLVWLAFRFKSGVRED